MTRIGSLFSGGGGLDLAVEAVFGSRVQWHSEIDPGASKVLAEHWPGIPNLGDITGVDWARVDPVDIMCGGFPCQDVSPAGRRAGLRDGSRSGLWAVFADAIAELRPPIVIVENVRGLLSAEAHRAMESENPTVGNGPGRPVLRAAGAVLGDLADLGYDAQWTTVAASRIGAPHRRERVFIVATDTRSGGLQRWGRSGAQRQDRHTSDRDSTPVDLLPTPSAVDGHPSSPGRHNSKGHQTTLPGTVRELLPTPEAKNAHAGPDYARMNRDRSGGHDLVTAIAYDDVAQSNWGKYAAAVHRWEQITRSAPAPTEPNTRGNPRLSPAFAEWMMGWPDGWATAVDIHRNDQLRIIGNGVVPQQAHAAIQFLLTVCEMAA